MRKRAVLIGVVRDARRRRGGFGRRRVRLTRNLDVRPAAHLPCRDSAWVAGIGFSTNSKVTEDSANVTRLYTDPACQTAGPATPRTWVRLLAKTGPTGGSAAGQVVLDESAGDDQRAGLRHPQGRPRPDRFAGLELLAAAHPGFDLVDSTDESTSSPATRPRRPLSASAPAGCVCAGDPVMAYGPGGLGPVSSLTIKQIAIEGQDTGGPDLSGLAVL